MIMPDPKLEIAEYFSSADGVATFGRYKCTLKKTGKHLDSPVAHLFKFRDGKIVRFVDYTDTAAYLEADRSNALGDRGQWGRIASCARVCKPADGAD